MPSEQVISGGRTICSHLYKGTLCSLYTDPHSHCCPIHQTTEPNIVPYVHDGQMCIICMEGQADFKPTCCHAHFHAKCLADHINSQPEVLCCPACRGDMYAPYDDYQKHVRRQLIPKVSAALKESVDIDLFGLLPSTDNMNNRQWTPTMVTARKFTKSWETLQRDLNTINNASVHILRTIRENQNNQSISELKTMVMPMVLNVVQNIYNYQENLQKYHRCLDAMILSRDTFKIY